MTTPAVHIHRDREHAVTHVLVRYVHSSGPIAMRFDVPDAIAHALLARAHRFVHRAQGLPDPAGVGFSLGGALGSVAHAVTHPDDVVRAVASVPDAVVKQAATAAAMTEAEIRAKSVVALRAAHDVVQRVARGDKLAIDGVRALAAAARAGSEAARKSLDVIKIAAKLPRGLAQLARAGAHAIETVDRATLSSLRTAARDAHELAPYAATIASFVPALGSGTAAVIAGADAIASGRRVDDALLAATRAAIPGGPLAQAAFDAGVALARGRNPLSPEMLAQVAAQLSPAARDALRVGAAVSLAQRRQKGLATLMEVYRARNV